MKIIKNYLLLYLIALLFYHCKKQEKFQAIEFSSPYKFNHEIREKLAKDTLPWKFQIAASDYASKGNYKEALKMWDSVFPVRERNYSTLEIDSIQKTYTPYNAIDFITSEAKKTRLTIINEAHHSSLHRNFTKQLLQKLYNNGYKHLGLEALTNGNEKDTGLNTRKYPIQTSGYYTKDPEFGNLIREALKIGFHVFAYEQTTNKNGKEREIEQAKNIQKVLNQFPDDKFLIHCGFDHALEGSHRSWDKAMAERLKEYTNINPLTINQVLYSEKSNPNFNHPLLKTLNIKEPTVLLDKNNKPLSYQRNDSWSDIAVLHPNTSFLNNKANWAESKIEIDLKELNINYPAMVLVYHKNESIQTAIPVNIIELENRQDSCLLYVEKGNYNIVITDTKNSFLLNKNIE
ncbi:hypothetical protein [Tenacibaculum crassostreae]|uniref:hypothetical protein n=1 Tax=Tenacibaculum crassostreae TaxID=502683 RepID=UPI00389583B4